MDCPRLRAARARCVKQLRVQLGLPLSLPILLGDVSECLRKAKNDARQYAATAARAPSVSHDLEPPRPIWYPGDPRPQSSSLPLASQRTSDKLKPAIACLFITAAFLREVHKLKGGGHR